MPSMIRLYHWMAPKAQAISHKNLTHHISAIAAVSRASARSRERESKLSSRENVLFVLPLYLQPVNKTQKIRQDLDCL